MRRNHVATTCTQRHTLKTNSLSLWERAGVRVFARQLAAVNIFNWKDSSQRCTEEHDSDAELCTPEIKSATLSFSVASVSSVAKFFSSFGVRRYDLLGGSTVLPRKVRRDAPYVGANSLRCTSGGLVFRTSRSPAPIVQARSIRRRCGPERCRRGRTRPFALSR